MSGEGSTPFFHTWRPFVKCSCYFFGADVSFISPCIFHNISLVKPYPTFAVALSDSPQPMRSQKLYRNLFLPLTNQNWKGNLNSLEGKYWQIPSWRETYGFTAPLPHFPNPHSNLQTHQSQFDWTEWDQRRVPRSVKSGLKYQLSTVWLQKGKHPSWSETSFLSRCSKGVIHYQVYGTRSGSTVHYFRFLAQFTRKVSCQWPSVGHGRFGLGIK